MKAATAVGMAKYTARMRNPTGLRPNAGSAGGTEVGATGELGPALGAVHDRGGQRLAAAHAEPRARPVGCLAGGAGHARCGRSGSCRRNRRWWRVVLSVLGVRLLLGAA